VARGKQRRDPVAALPLEAARAEVQGLERQLAELPPIAALADQTAVALDEALARDVSSLERLGAELSRAEGALGHVGGEVVEERVRRNGEALSRARDLARDQELEYDAYALLATTLKQVETEQGSHLGKALEVPVSELLSSATAGRYAGVGLDTGLGTSGIFVAGAARPYAELSQGTQEQLATILRLCIAEHLGFAIVLDDHLAQTHRERARWFRDYLRDVSARIQVVVVTARPEDYLDSRQLPGDEAVRESDDGAVRAVDLGRVIERANYDVLPATARKAL
jgi:uncharacterized protein YhaN